MALFFGFAQIGEAQADEPKDLVFKPSARGFVATWLQLGPLDAPRRLRKQPDILAKRDPLQVFEIETPPRLGDAAAGMQWKVRCSRSKSLRLFGKRPATVYLASVLGSSRARRVWLATGSDGGIEIWLNGKRLLSRNLKRRASPDTDLVALELPAGESLLVLRLWKPDPGPWRVYTRLMDEGFGPDDDIRIILPGTSGHLTRALEWTGRLVVDRVLDLAMGAVDVRVRLAFDGGRPIGSEMESLLTFGGPGRPKAQNMVVSLSGEEPSELDLGGARFEGERAPQTVRATMGTASFSGRLAFQMPLIKRLARASAYFDKRAQGGEIPVSSIQSAKWRIEHLGNLIAAGDEDYRYLRREIRDTEAITRALAEGKDPYANRRNEVQRRGYQSTLDGSLQYYALYVPPGWREKGEKRHGLVISLHGLNSTPMKAMQAVFGKPLEEGEPKQVRERHPKPVGAARFFVLAPTGFGNTGYRAYGEADVFEALEQVRGRYRIDPNRIYITGASMGGIGAAAVPLHRPDIFAAAAPLCGYHSLFRYRSLFRVTFNPWERFLAGFRSNAEWAENGRHLPLYVVHGLKDNPGNSKVLVDRYKKLRYKVKYETPDLGHNVWDETYKDRRIFGHFARFKRAAHPRKVTFRTAGLRYQSSHWIVIDGAEDYARWTSIDAIWSKDNSIRIETDNISALTVLDDKELHKGEPVTISIDGEKLGEISESGPWRFFKKDGHWKAGFLSKCEGPCKRPGFAGPIGDALYEPLLFVYGATNPGEAALAKRLIDGMKNPRRGVTMSWPVKADTEVSEEDLEKHSIVIVGTSAGNKLLARIRDKLPIRIEDGAVSLGKKQFAGQGVAASFIYPNPLNPERYVVVHTGVSLQALFHVGHLPGLLPDYIVYDASDWGRKGGLVLDDRKILTAGFFDSNWLGE
ncbi:MAG: prolyl oligopeptidase family serine peptidase [Deltaproteobacteria bacterium]|nr:prolyl oligopeptidase family serine peptidase [Deltaproteobacteria bacterium]